MPSIRCGDSLGLNALPRMDIPTLNNIINAKITNNKKANFATKLFDSKNSRVPKVPLFDVENELNTLISYRIYRTLSNGSS